MDLNRVIIVETQDYRRLVYIYTLLASLLKSYEKILYGKPHKVEEINIIDIQAFEKYKYVANISQYSEQKNREKLNVTSEVFSPTGVRNLLCDEQKRPVFYIYKIIRNQTEADILSKIIMHLTDPHIINSFGKLLSQTYVIIITTDRYLFQPHVLNHCAVIKINYPDDDEIDEAIRYVLNFIKESVEADLSNPTGDYESKYSLYHRARDAYEKHKNEIISLCKGLTTHEIITACKASIIDNKPFDQEYFLKTKLSMLDNNNLTYIPAKYGFNDVAGMDLLKDEFNARLIMPLKNKEVFDRLNVSYSRGILLVGPPGVGKTYIINALPKETNLPMVSLNPSQIFSKYVGESESKLKNILDIVEAMSPSILFIDEMDSLLSTRDADTTSSGVLRNIAQILLTWLGNQERKTFVIGATNLAENIDEAYLRPGRIDVSLLVLPPTYQERIECLKYYINKRPNNITEEQIDKCAKRMEYFTPAMIKDLVEKASRNAALDGCNELIVNYIESLIDTYESTKTKVIEMTERFIKKYEAIPNADIQYLEKLKSSGDNNGISIASI